MKIFTNRSEIRKLTHPELVQVIKEFTQDEKKEFKIYLEEKMGTNTNSNTMFLHAKNFIAEKQFPKKIKSTRTFSDDVLDILKEV
jgi:hypothetical protein